MCSGCVCVCVNVCKSVWRSVLDTKCMLHHTLLAKTVSLNLVLTDCIYSHPAFSRDLFVSDLYSQPKDCGHLVPIYMCLTSEFRVSFLHSTGDILPTESFLIF